MSLFKSIKKAVKKVAKVVKDVAHVTYGTALAMGDLAFNKGQLSEVTAKNLGHVSGEAGKYDPDTVDVLQGKQIAQAADTHNYENRDYGSSRGSEDEENKKRKRKKKANFFGEAESERNAAPMETSAPANNVQ
jgi:hypothetical protein